jgi:hypothetical protein
MRKKTCYKDAVKHSHSDTNPDKPILHIMGWESIKKKAKTKSERRMVFSQIPLRFNSPSSVSCCLEK